MEALFWDVLLLWCIAFKCFYHILRKQQ